MYTLLKQLTFKMLVSGVICFCLYYSDIVGFTALSAQSSPLEVNYQLSDNILFLLVGGRGRLPPPPSVGAERGEKPFEEVKFKYLPPPHWDGERYLKYMSIIHVAPDLFVALLYAAQGKREKLLS